MVGKDQNTENYIEALEDELLASLEREEKNDLANLSLRRFVVEKAKRTKLYENVVADPDSKMGKAVRLPRSLYRLVRNPEVRKNLSQKKTVNRETNFLAPWELSLESRKNIAKTALADGKKIALYFIEKPDSSTFRYRCYNTFRATENSKKWQAVYFFKKELSFVEELLPKSSVLIFGRQSGQEKIVGKLINLAHKNKIKVGLDIDDLVFDLKYLDTVLDTIGENANRSYWAAYFASVQAMAKEMDFYITTNKFLSEKIKGSFDKPCMEIPNSLNQDQVFASEVYLKQKEKLKSDKFVMGYFSGSPTHKKDLDEALPEVMEFMKNHDDVVLNIVGFMKFSKETKKYINKGRINFLPMVDFRKLQRLMAEVDVNIAPLVVNDFTNCKSELKFFEAAIVETVTIASPTYTFKRAISDGENGFLAEPGEWYKKLEYLYNNTEESKKIAKVARRYALENYYGEKFLKEVENAYDYFA